MFGLLSSGGRVQLSYCGKGLQASCGIHSALELWWGGLFVLAVVDSSLFVLGGTYQFAVGAQPPLKGGSESC